MIESKSNSEVDLLTVVLERGDTVNWLYGSDTHANVDATSEDQITHKDTGIDDTCHVHATSHAIREDD
ncbi:hypothetical protein TorRG33x02_263120 [Trema orientale]|uniref:Uncharacterized protein n=1 Tax=Trema orientale TaxID=63057 RepID=A0A2P5D3W1_TREOI|nr:hypothetical protein TorRG33x02_263120 [Trema orientale]